MKKTLLLSVVVFCMASCVTIGTPTGSAIVVTSVTSPEAVTSNPVGSKVGISSALNILGIVATGDASIQTAANSAGIKRISHVDSKKKSILGLFSSYKVFVYGE